MCNFRGGSVFVFCCLLLVACDQEDKRTEKLQAYRKDPYSSRLVNFDYSNEMETSVWVDSVMVLNKDFTAGSIGPRVANCGGIGDARNGCTPEALLGTDAHFKWWQFAGGRIDNAVRKGPADPSKKFQCKIPFPEFDLDAKEWEFNYTLQPDNVWAGRFVGVEPKQPGARKVEKTKGRWLHLQFRNQTGQEVGFGSSKTKLVNSTRETLLYLPEIQPTGKFVAYAATCEDGSIYQPEPGSAIELVWYPGKHRQTVSLPEFSPDEKDWYCHFTLGKNSNSWTVEFEGVKE